MNVVGEDVLDDRLGHIYGIAAFCADGAFSTPSGYTDETTNTSRLVYLRSRYYNSLNGRFLSRDTWGGWSMMIHEAVPNESSCSVHINFITKIEFFSFNLE